MQLKTKNMMTNIIKIAVLLILLAWSFFRGRYSGGYGQDVPIMGKCS